MSVSCTWQTKHHLPMANYCWFTARLVAGECSTAPAYLVGYAGVLARACRTPGPHPSLYECYHVTQGLPAPHVPFHAIQSMSRPMVRPGLRVLAAARAGRAVAHRRRRRQCRPPPRGCCGTSAAAAPGGSARGRRPAPGYPRLRPCPAHSDGDSSAGHVIHGWPLAHHSNNYQYFPGIRTGSSNGAPGWCAGAGRPASPAAPTRLGRQPAVRRPPPGTAACASGPGPPCGPLPTAAPAPPARPLPPPAHLAFGFRVCIRKCKRFTKTQQEGKEMGMLQKI